jgi:integrase
MAANNNVPEQTLKQWLGHRDSQMIRHYYHLHDEESKRQMDKIVLAASPAKVAGTACT